MSDTHADIDALAELELTRARTCGAFNADDPLPDGSPRRCGRPAVRAALYTGTDICGTAWIYECAVAVAKFGKVCQHGHPVTFVATVDLPTAGAS